MFYYLLWVFTGKILRTTNLDRLANEVIFSPIGQMVIDFVFQEELMSDKCCDFDFMEQEGSLYPSPSCKNQVSLPRC